MCKFSITWLHCNFCSCMGRKDEFYREKLEKHWCMKICWQASLMKVKLRWRKNPRGALMKFSVLDWGIVTRLWIWGIVSKDNELSDDLHLRCAACELPKCNQPSVCENAVQVRCRHITMANSYAAKQARQSVIENLNSQILKTWNFQISRKPVLYQFFKRNS